MTSDRAMVPSNSTICPGPGEIEIERSLTAISGDENEEEEPGPRSGPAPLDEVEGAPPGASVLGLGISRVIRMARYLQRCSTRALEVVLMYLKRKFRQTNERTAQKLKKGFLKKVPRRVFLDDFHNVLAVFHVRVKFENDLDLFGAGPTSIGVGRIVIHLEGERVKVETGYFVF